MRVRGRSLDTELTRRRALPHIRKVNLVPGENVVIILRS